MILFLRKCKLGGDCLLPIVFISIVTRVKYSARSLTTSRWLYDEHCLSVKRACSLVSSLSRGSFRRCSFAAKRALWATLWGCCYLRLAASLVVSTWTTSLHCRHTCRARGWSPVYLFISQGSDRLGLSRAARRQRHRAITGRELELFCRVLRVHYVWGGHLFLTTLVR